MTQVYYPRIDEEEHVSLEKKVERLCFEFNVDALDLPQYYDLDDTQKKRYAEFFCDATLYIRSLPDKLIIPRTSHFKPFFVDFKTTASRKETGNIAIELSSFYFNLQRTLLGVPAYYCISIPKPVVFSPKIVKPSRIFIASCWRKDCFPFKRWAQSIRSFFGGKHPQIIDAGTHGSGDPFVLLEKKKIVKKSTPFIDLIRK